MPMFAAAEILQVLELLWFLPLDSIPSVASYLAFGAQLNDFPTSIIPHPLMQDIGKIPEQPR